MVLERRRDVVGTERGQWRSLSEAFYIARTAELDIGDRRETRSVIRP
jgi:hypothetical protein